MSESVSERQQSRKLQIKRVNFLAADVAQYQRGIIRGQTAPRANFTNRQADSFQTDNFLELVVADPHAIDSQVTTPGVKINIIPIPRPVRESGSDSFQLRPLLGLEIKEH